MLKSILSISIVSLPLMMLSAQPDSLIEPPIFKDQTITYPEEPPIFVPKTKSVYLLQTEDFEIKIKCPTEVSIDSLDYIDQKTYKCQKGDVTLTIIRTVYDNGMYHSDSLKTLEFDLDYTQRKFMENNQIRVIGAVPRIVQGYPGKEFRFEYLIEDKIAFRRVYIVKNTLYELFYEAPKYKSFHNEIDEFFNSFMVLNIEENEKPYFIMPSEEEINNLPYTANFHGKTIKKVEVVDSYHGKLAVIAEANEIRDKDKSGIISLMILQTVLPNNVSEEDKKTIIKDQTELVFNMYADAQLLEEKYDDKGRKISIFSYKIGGVEKVIDERISFFQNDKMYLINALYRANKPKDKRVDEFFESFKIIE